LSAGRAAGRDTSSYPISARYYLPSLGRFITEDPLGLSAGLNPYLYCRQRVIY
jgi:RHS repeat-associated protein